MNKFAVIDLNDTVNITFNGTVINDNVVNTNRLISNWCENKRICTLVEHVINTCTIFNYFGTRSNDKGHYGTCNTSVLRNLLEHIL